MQIVQESNMPCNQRAVQLLGRSCRARPSLAGVLGRNQRNGGTIILRQRCGDGKEEHRSSRFDTHSGQLSRILWFSTNGISDPLFANDQLVE
jgi:hypothetical protein